MHDLVAAYLMVASFRASCWSCNGAWGEGMAGFWLQLLLVLMLSPVLR